MKVARPVLRGPRRPRGHGATRHEVTVADASGLDIDHMVPLAEAWDSGASAWSAVRREAYANDLGQDTSLVAVTARSNRSKADQAPAEWLPPAPDAVCRYVAEWTATKLRWDLTTDQVERDRLTGLADGCGDTTVTYMPVPSAGESGFEGHEATSRSLEASMPWAARC